MTDCRRCATCTWWQRMGPRLANASRDPSASFEEGTCQAHAPVVQAAQTFPVSVFPVTHEDRFCGDWKARDGGGPDGDERIIAFPLTPTANKVAA
ncbi:MAG: hypothetical protein PGN16_10640 [Sphingomonas phyllosphaerae]|uniref:hypothetical protein n=1 Tax=Sphingomonas phyllosphaerae TaxID=257003 RepID=UPI002FF7CD44